MESVSAVVEFEYSPDFWEAAIESAEEVEVRLPLIKKINSDNLFSIARCIDYSPPDLAIQPIVEKASPFKVYKLIYTYFLNNLIFPHYFMLRLNTGKSRKILTSKSMVNLLNPIILNI